MPNSVFKDIFVPHQLQQATQATLQMWFTTYLREIERRLALPVGFLETPKTYTTRNNTDDTSLLKEIPAVVILTPGLVGRPTRDGNGQHRAVWALGVGVMMGADTEDNAWLKSQCYGAAVRTIILQKPPMGRIEWIDEQYPDLPIRQQNMRFKAANLIFTADIENVVTRPGGPPAPTDVETDYGQVQKVFVDVKNVGSLP